MSSVSDDLLRDAPRCVLAFAGEDGPRALPMAFWSDGASLWMTTSASSVTAGRFRNGDDGHESQCAVYVPPLEPRATEPDTGEDARDGHASGPPAPARGLAIGGSARLYGADDPLGLLVHSPVISAALTALAVKNAATLAGYLLDLPRVPRRWLPAGRVAIRMRMERIRPLVPPEEGPGIAPALPGVVPPDIRRALAGRRRVAVASAEASGTAAVTVQPAVLSAGLRLDFGREPAPAAGTRAVVVLDSDPRGRPGDVRGVALHGRIEAGGALAPERATWWHGFETAGARIDPVAAGGVVLPD